jgi:type I site-specific restriction-modification system R (restriction) subunit
MSRGFAESDAEEAALGWLETLGYAIKHGPEIAFGVDGGERSDPGYRDTILQNRLYQALNRLNPGLPSAAIGDAYRKLLRVDGPNLLARNRALHRMLVDGVTIEYARADGSIAGAQARVLDFEEPERNDWLAVNQFTIVEGQEQRRPDIVIFVNGLPLGVVELKNPTDANATVWDAVQQLENYQAFIPALFTYDAALVASDGIQARIGALGGGKEWFKPWRTIGGREDAPASMPELEVVLRGVFEQRRFLDLVRHFIAFEDQGGGVLAKKIAGYHQFHAVNVAVEETLRAANIAVEAEEAAGTYFARHPAGGAPGDKRVGVVWHTQGSGKSLTMAFYAGRLVLHPAMENPTIVVIADEAHRSQYDFIDGLARHLHDALPNASFVGFTGTPIEKTDANTRAVFGDYISIYDIQRAVSDGATVPIYYESRLAKLQLEPSERPRIDPEFQEVTEGEEVERKEKLKTKWAQLEAVVGSGKRVKLIARDLVTHFEERLAAMDGKAMIVCMSRRICVDLYRELVALRPEWQHVDDDKGALKVVMTGSAADPADWQPHIRNKKRREGLANRFRDAGDPFRIVIVRDMWLTGFDAPSLHTMYVDKPMRGHGLMQTIARVNRVFKDKPGGLVVDYLGLAEELKQALAIYTESGGTGRTAIDQHEAVAVMLEKYEICCGLFHGFDRSLWTAGTAQQRLSLIPAGQEFVLAQERGRERFPQTVNDLSRAFALAVPSEKALRIRDDVAFFQAVRAALLKNPPGERKTDEQLDHAIRQIVSKALVADEVVDIFAAAGLKKPDISILSDEFLAEIRGMPQKNLAVELLRKLLLGEIKTRSRHNVVQARSFADLLDRAIRKYQNRAIETAQVIEELIGLAKDMRAANARGEELGLSEQELAFYDALETNDSAVKVLGEPTLTMIARELVAAVRNNVTIDWTLRENVRAQMRVLVRRILRKYGYPPDKQEKATQTVLEQAELFSEAWASAPA